GIRDFHVTGVQTCALPISILPSSLAMVNSSTLGFSPQPPVSVCGTGLNIPEAERVFPVVRLPALSAQPKPCTTVGYQQVLRICLQVLYLNPSTHYSVSARQCHSYVTASQYIRVREY